MLPPPPPDPPTPFFFLLILFTFICAFINKYVFVFLVGRSDVDGFNHMFRQHSCSAVQIHCPLFLDELAVVGWFALCSSALSSAKLSDFFEAPAFFFFFWSTSKWSVFCLFCFWSPCLRVTWLFWKHSLLSGEGGGMIHSSFNAWHWTGYQHWGPIWETVSVKCADLPVCMLSQFRDQRTMSDLE